MWPCHVYNFHFWKQIMFFVLFISNSYSLEGCYNWTWVKHEAVKERELPVVKTIIRNDLSQNSCDIFQSSAVLVIIHSLPFIFISLYVHVQYIYTYRPKSDHRNHIPSTVFFCRLTCHASSSLCTAFEIPLGAYSYGTMLRSWGLVCGAKQKQCRFTKVSLLHCVIVCHTVYVQASLLKWDQSCVRHHMISVLW